MGHLHVLKQKNHFDCSDTDGSKTRRNLIQRKTGGRDSKSKISEAFGAKRFVEFNSFLFECSVRQVEKGPIVHRSFEPG